MATPQASWTAAAAFGRIGVYDLTELGLLPVVLDEHEIGDELVARYITPLGTGDAADVAAGRLFVQHNMIRYRLRRYEKLTGINDRDRVKTGSRYGIASAQVMCPSKSSVLAVSR